MKNTRFLFLALILGILPFAGCGKSNSEDKDSALKESSGENAASGGEEGDSVNGGKKKQEVKAIPVEVARAEIGSISSTIELDSVLETENEATIHAESAGLILEVLVEEGDRVYAGQILARLENDVQSVSAAEAKASYELEKANFKRTEDLYESKLINDQDYERAKYDLSQAKLKLDRANIELENTIVRSTIDGVVTQRMAKVGHRATNNMDLFVIMNLEDLYAEVNVPSMYLSRIRPNQDSIIDADALKGVSFQGKVKLVSRVIDPKSGTFRVKVALQLKSDKPVYPGLFVSVQIVLDTKDDAIILPKEAIVYEGDRKFVFVVNDGIVSKRVLNDGYSSGSVIEALSGVEEGEAIVVVGQNTLKDGAKVRIVEDSLGIAGNNDESKVES